MHLDAIAKQSHILTPQNIDEYFNILQDKIKNYDIKPFIKDIKTWHENYLKKQKLKPQANSLKIAENIRQINVILDKFKAICILSDKY